MPIQTLLERLTGELLHKGSPQMLHFVLAEQPYQQQNVVATIVHLAKKAFVELKEPDLTADGERRTFWQSLSLRKYWIVCRFGTAGNEELMRQAAVEVLCARTNEFCPMFRVIVLLTSRAEFDALPPICRLLGGQKVGTCRMLDLADTVETDPQLLPDESTGLLPEPPMKIRDAPLEEWLDYSNVEDAEGDIAAVQERVFNSDPNLTTVKYSKRYGRGAPYIRILRDALKFNIVVHTLDLSHSECGDVVGMCLLSILYTSRKLKRIILDNCSLTDVGVAQVAQAVASSECVRALKLSRNPSMTDASLIALASAVHVSASRNASKPSSPSSSSPPSSPQLSSHASRSKAQLEELDISGNNIVYDARFEWSVAALGSLWDAMGTSKFLKRVNISDCGLLGFHLADASARWLSQPSNRITHLNVSHNYLGDEVITAMLPHLRHVEQLNLEHVQLGACGFRAVGYALSELKLPVQDLRLDANNASLEKPFDETLIKTSELPEGMLNVVLDTTTGAALFAVEALSGNQTLKRLSFSRTMMGDAAVMSLCDMLINRQCAVDDVDISGNCNVEEASAHKLKELLVGGYFTRAAVDGEAPLPPPIRSLSLAGNSTAIGERALLALYQNKGLEHLDLSNMALIDAMLLPLSEAMKLNASGLVLQTLRIGRNNLWFDGVQNIAGHLNMSKTLRELSLAGTWQAYDDEAGRPTSLSKSRDEGLHYLSPLLDVIRLSRDCPLEVLDLSSNDISVKCALGIASAVAQNTKLQRVLLIDNPLLNNAVLSDTRLVIVEDC